MTDNTQSASIWEELLTVLILSPTPERPADHFNKASDVGQVHNMFGALSDMIQ